MEADRTGYMVGDDGTGGSSAGVNGDKMVGNKTVPEDALEVVEDVEVRK